jgi:transposase, IS5 family
MIPRVKQVMRQTRARLIKGNTHLAGKIVSLFEPRTEIIRKGKAAKPTEFGKMIKIQEAEGQIITPRIASRNFVTGCLMEDVTGREEDVRGR